ncbi:MAG TPA: glutathione S-transferase family protein [Kofleriaceae bacterium]
MTRPKLTYFDIPTSRGEECRLALHLAGVEFDDNRIKGTEWAALKPSTPFGSMPYLELPGKPPLAQANAILVYLGRTYGLHPSDNFEAAQHEELMSYAEELRGHVSRTLRMPEDEKKRVRETLVASYFPAWGANVDRHIAGSGPFVAGAKLQVVDLKLHMIVRWFIGGVVDHIPATIFADAPKLTRLYEAVRDHEGVKAWYARA